MRPNELKTLPKELRYNFLDDSNKYLVIITTDLTNEKEGRLMEVLKAHRKVFGY
jgi:hypothetical protein